MDKGKSVAPTTHQSRFAVLGEMGQDGDMDNELAQLKQQIQAVPSPQTRAGAGPAHERPKHSLNKDKGPTNIHVMHASKHSGGGGHSHQAGQAGTSNRAPLKDVSNNLKAGRSGTKDTAKAWSKNSEAKSVCLAEVVAGQQAMEVEQQSL